MKHLKKLLVVVAALAMAMALSAVAWAADNAGYHISLNSNDTHTYTVYQVLTGDLSADGKTLSNTQWGADVDAVNAGDVDAFAASLEGKSEAEVAALVAAKLKADAVGVGTVTKDAPINGLEAGYYVIVDTTNPLGKLDTKALNVVKVVNNVDDMSIKWGTTEDVKTITGDTLGKDEGQNSYDPGRTNDNVSIGDTVNYNIAATVPDNADKFKEGTFFFVITDKLSSGLTFTEGSIEVYDGNTKLDESKYTVQYNINGNTFEIGLIGAASYKGKTINVKYSAVLNENAVIGDAGNPNTSTVKFSNDPNKTYNGSPEDTDHPGFPDSTKEVPTGETPESETITYSTGIEILKVDENGEPLTGATFEIAGQSVKKVVTKTETFVESDQGAYYKLKNGTYTMTVPRETNEMIPAEKGATKGYVEDSEATGADAIVVDGKTYRPYVPATDAGKTLYVLKEGSAASYESTTVKYEKTVTQKTVDADARDHKMSEAVDANGLVRFDGLGEGTFTVTETVTPDGYNTISPIKLTVTYNEQGEAKFSVTGGSASYEDGVVKIKVVNKKGAELPSTGGMGTTILYVVGGIMVLLAVVFLITKKRVASKKDESEMI